MSAQKQIFTAYLVDGVRTPGGRRNGGLRQYHPVSLGAETINALMQRNKFDYKLVDQCIFGCVSQVGAQSTNVARNVVLHSNLPDTISGFTIDKQCGSGLAAIMCGLNSVIAGTEDIIIVGGVEHMTSVPLGANAHLGIKAGMGSPLTPLIHEKFPTPDGSEPPVFSQFLGAELVAKEFGISRSDADAYAAESHRLAAAATKRGAFKNEIVPLKGLDKEGKEILVSADEGIRPSTTMESLGKLKPLLDEYGCHTAGSASQICDGASCLLIMNERGLKKSGLTPRAKVICVASAGDDPVVMLRAPIFCTEKALKKADMTIDDIDLVECNEAFAAIPLMLMRKFIIPRNKINVAGGAIALGHPLGSTGVKLTITAINQLEQMNKDTALITLCEGGGQGNTLLISRVKPAAKL